MRKTKHIASFIILVLAFCLLMPSLSSLFSLSALKSRNMRDLRLSAVTADGETLPLKTNYNKNSDTIYANVPFGVSIKSVSLSLDKKCSFEINGENFTEQTPVTGIVFGRRYPLKIYSEKQKLLDEACLVFKRDTQQYYFSFDTSKDGVIIVSTADANALPDPKQMESGGYGADRNGGFILNCLWLFVKTIVVIFIVFFITIVLKSIKKRPKGGK